MDKFIKRVQKMEMPIDIDQISSLLNEIYTEGDLRGTNIKTKFMHAIQIDLMKRQPAGIILHKLPIWYSVLKSIYPNLNTLSMKLSNVRKWIKENQLPDVYEKSTQSKYFNLSKEQRMEKIDKYKAYVRERNMDKIQVSLEAMLDRQQELLLSTNVYDIVLACMMASGTRPVEIFDKNQFEQIDEKPSWIRVLNIAKKRDTQDNHQTTRPVIGLTPQAFISLVNIIRNTFKDKVVISTNGTLASDKNTTLNKRFAFRFPEFANETNKSSLLRKIYGNMSYELHADRTKINLNTWLSSVLGHDVKDLSTSFSYSFVNITKKQNQNVDDLKAELEHLKAILESGKITHSVIQPVYQIGREPAESKYVRLERIIQEYPSITNHELRKRSGVGSVIVNRYLKLRQNKELRDKYSTGSKQKDDEKQVVEEKKEQDEKYPLDEKEQEQKNISNVAPVRRSARLKSKKD